MKDNLEKNIKQSLENHEMPYNASAWTAMSAKLDAVKPTSTSVSNVKWYVAAASVVILGIIGYLILSNTPEATKTQTANTENPSSNEVSPQKVDSNRNINETEIETDSNSTNSNRKVIPQKEASQSNTQIGTLEMTNLSEVSALKDEIESIQKLSLEQERNNSNVDNSDQVANTSNKKIVLPILKNVCEGDVVSVSNENNVPLVINGNETHFVIPANTAHKFRIESTGLHTITALNSDNDDKTTFNVKEVPKADFTVDYNTKFEKGLPTTILEANDNGVQYTWVIGQNKLEGIEVNAHLFNKGNHDVTLTVKSNNGCTNMITKSIRVDENYNLMAVNSFVPEDSDPRLNTFMPFALTQRNVQFNLMIIDPSDGHTVYSTNDASASWDGTDKAFGNKVKYGTTYIWKVTLTNPEVNEGNEYAGNITPIRR